MRGTEEGEIRDKGRKRVMRGQKAGKIKNKRRKRVMRRAERRRDLKREDG